MKRPFEFSEKFLTEAIKEQIMESKLGQLRPLICTDDLLLDLDIRCAQHIVHFTLPSTWTMFTFRFSVFLEYHENLLANKVGTSLCVVRRSLQIKFLLQSNTKPAATSIVFLDEYNNEELPRIVDFMQMRGNVDIPQEVLRFTEVNYR